MRRAKSILETTAALLVAVTICASAASAVEPRVVVNNGTSYDVVITDVSASPDVINNIDWQSLRFEFNGMDFTATVFGLAGTPLLQIPAVSRSSITIRIAADLTTLAGRVSVCYVGSLGGGCGANQVQLRSAFSKPADTAGALPQGAWKNGSIYYISAVEFRDSAPRVIEEFDAIVRNASGTPPSWSTMVWRYSVWDSVAAFNADRLGGNVASGALSVSGTPIQWGGATSPQWRVTLVPPTGIFVPAGFKLIAFRTDNQSSLMTLESSASSSLPSSHFATDYVPNLTGKYVPDMQPPFTNGRSALNLSGY